MNDEATIARFEQLLEDTLELAEENNRLLKKIQRGNALAFWAKAIMWIVILVLPFIFLGPLIKTLIPASDTSKAGGSLFGFPTPDEIQNIVNSYRATSTTK